MPSIATDSICWNSTTNLEIGEGVQSMAPFLTGRFTEDFEFVDIKHKDYKILLKVAVITSLLTPPNIMLAHIVLMFLSATRNLKRRWLEIGCGVFIYTSGDWILGSTMNLFGRTIHTNIEFRSPV